MRQHVNILIIALSLGQFACNTFGRQESKAEKTIEVDSVKQKDAHAEIRLVKDRREDCIRGQAGPIIKKTIFPNTKFILQPDSLIAIETIDFDNGDKLIINNWGCEYYVLTFRFETSRFKADTTAMKYWYVAAYKMMVEVKEGIDAPIQIDKGLKALNSHISKKAFDLKLRTEIDFGGDEIRDFVTVERIEKLTDTKFALTLSFATGPL
jgi:hypothetical protein